MSKGWISFFQPASSFKKHLPLPQSLQNELQTMEITAAITYLHGLDEPAQKCAVKNIKMAAALKEESIARCQQELQQHYESFMRDPRFIKTLIPVVGGLVWLATSFFQAPLGTEPTALTSSECPEEDSWLSTKYIVATGSVLATNVIALLHANYQKEAHELQSAIIHQRKELERFKAILAGLDKASALTEPPAVPAETFTAF